MDPLITRSDKAVFVTFYSFKGGVGRTMALVNTACILAGRGRRVLMIDFDLEAPGLTLFDQKSQENSSPAIQQAGLIELIHDFLSNPQESPLADKDNKASFHDHYVRRLAIPEKLRRIEGGYLDLMPCGRLDKSYEQRLYEIKFDKLYEEGIGQPLFKHLKNVIRDSDLYDYVLIDSRTGLSDEGSICTRDLADHLVILMSLNRQNVEGTVRVLRQLRAADWGRGRTVFIASPMPEHYEELREKRMAEAQRAIRGAGFSADLKLRIPYHPRLALDEEPFVFDWTGTDLFAAYESIQRELRVMAQDTPDSWSQQAIEAINKNNFTEALRLLKELSIEAPETAKVSLSLINYSLIETNSELKANSEPFLNLWLDIADDKILVRRRQAEVLSSQGYYKRALDKLRKALRVVRKQQNARYELLIITDIGNALYYMGLYNESLEEYEHALLLGEKLDDERSIAISHSSIGSLYLSLGQFDSALEYYEKALESFKKLNEEQHIAIAQSNLATLYRLQGLYDMAEQLYMNSLSLPHNSSQIAYNRVGIGKVLQGQGKYDEALQTFEEGLELYKAANDRVNLAWILSEIGLTHIKKGQVSQGLQLVDESMKTVVQSDANPYVAFIYVYYCEGLLAAGNIQEAINCLDDNWSFIQRYGGASNQAAAQVLRARAKAKIGDQVGAAEDARDALEFYQKNEIHTAWSKEAEELLALVSAG